MPTERFTLTHCLVGLGLLAGCHGMEPLAVKTRDPLRRDDRDVLLAGRGCADSCADEAGRGGVGDSPGKGRPAPWSAGSPSEAGGAGPETPTPTAGRRGGPPGLPLPTSPEPCGNGLIEPGESCDTTDLNGFTCASFGYVGGVLTCDPQGCFFDMSQCRLPPPSVGARIDAGLDDDDGGIELPGL